MTQKHTQGPWHVGLRQAEQIIYNTAGWAVANATVYHGEHDREETKANARLIAEAPAMLDALRELLADKYLADPINADRMASARAILARIDGGV